MTLPPSCPLPGPCARSRTFGKNAVSATTTRVHYKGPALQVPPDRDRDDGQPIETPTGKVARPAATRERSSHRPKRTIGMGPAPDNSERSRQSCFLDRRRAWEGRGSGCGFSGGAMGNRCDCFRRTADARAALVLPVSTGVGRCRGLPFELAGGVTEPVETEVVARGAATPAASLRTELAAWARQQVGPKPALPCQLCTGQSDDHIKRNAEGSV